MKCRVCGGMLRTTTTDLPFKVSERTIVILKNLPVAQCESARQVVPAMKEVRRLDLHADELAARLLPLLFKPVGVDEARSVVVGLIDDGAQQGDFGRPGIHG